MKYRSLAGVLLAAALAACSGGDATGPSGGTISVQPNPVTVAVGDTVRLNVTASGAVTFRSLNPAIATVSSAGTVTGVSVGATQIVVESGSRSDTVAVNVVAGDVARTFNVNTDQACGDPLLVGFRTAAVGQHVILMEDTRNPPGGFTSAEYQEIANRFDTLVWPTDVQAFGAPTDIDNNGKVIVLFTRAVNELTPANVNFVVGGFFFSRDLFPHTATTQLQGCEGSNLGEMFYMLAPDPQGTINGNERTAQYVSNTTIGTLAHELQHLINSSRRLFVNNAPTFEAVWLDEGLAHIAEELNFYAASGLGPRQNIGQSTLFASQTRVDAFNEFGIANFGRFGEYLRNPPPNSPYADNDSLATRGAAWSLLRYSADRKGAGDQPFFNALVNSADSGLVNLGKVVGPELGAYVRDWQVANYADDAVTGAEARFQHPSWNFRDLYSNKAFGGYPLQVNALVSGSTRTATIRSGSAAYYRFGVASGATADVRVSAAGTTVANACTPVTLSVGQAVQVDAATTAAFCVAGGTGSDYVLVVGYPVLSTGRTAAVAVVGTNVTAVSGGPTPNRLPGISGPAFTPFTAVGGDGGFELALRRRERAELSPLIGRRGASASIAAAVAPTGVTLTLMRTR
ncbi:Ig-like domain-containing protein [Longimicrobium sp.]|uniref:Ig-like domain-containing protein n=1 Tax=Longimicrobium sp. TaxID=2029185 RepID=UPI002C9E56C3|nr:Ig-like domain-containing protein [Longimicrobium sp.]HSU12451.1 Ig-like domain-containing protein [Longimicrobium sp.]